MTPSSAAIHQDSIIIDAVCPLIMDDPAYIDLYSAGGCTIVGATVGGWEGTAPTLRRIGKWLKFLRERDDVILVRNAAQIRGIKDDGKIGAFFHIQGTDPIEDNLDNIDLFKTLGVGMVQLTYNVRNRVGDGCEEIADSGLSRFGRLLVERLNQSSVIVDCSHTGFRTTMDAIEISRSPVVLSHSNVVELHPSARNVPRELVVAIAEGGGLIGVAGFPAMLSMSTSPSIDDFVAHIDALVEMVGIDHVGLGIDYYWGQAGIASDEKALADYNEAISAGRWSEAYPPPPHRYPAEIQTPQLLGALTEQLTKRGYEPENIEKILGENWMRIMSSVWDA